MAYFMAGANGLGPPQPPPPEPRNRLKESQAEAKAQAQKNSRRGIFRRRGRYNYNSPYQRQSRRAARQLAIDPELPDFIFEDLALFTVSSQGSATDDPTPPTLGEQPKKRFFKNPFHGFVPWSIRRSKQIFWKLCHIGRTPPPLTTTSSCTSGGHEDDMPSRVKQRRAPQDPRALVNGHCMTCGSLMQWPKDLGTFRCTICVTVNQLSPLRFRPKPHYEGDSSGRSSSSVPRLSITREGQDTGSWPISLPITQKLVRDCLHIYLTAELCGDPSTRDDVSEKISQAELSPGRRFELYTGCNELPYNKADQSSSTKNPEYAPKYTFGEAPTLRPSPSNVSVTSRSTVERVRSAANPSDQNSISGASTFKSNPTKIFESVQDYIRECFENFDNISSSFPVPTRGSGRSGGNFRTRRPSSNHSSQMSTSPTDIRLSHSPPLCEIDPKLLLLGSFAENGTWWAGGQAIPPPQKPISKGEGHHTIKPSPINWPEVIAWYDSIINAAGDWTSMCADLSHRSDYVNPSQQELKRIEENLIKSQLRLRRALLKLTENLLKNPGGRLTDPEEMRGLLILLENPLLHSDSDDHDGNESSRSSTISSQLNLPNSGPLSGRHSGIIKRIVGLISNLPPDLHNHLIAHWSRSRPERFLKTKELIFGFFTYRLLRQRPSQGHERTETDLVSDLIPFLEPGSTGSSLHHEIGSSSRTTTPSEKLTPASYSKDWQIKAACQVLSLLFNANNPCALRRLEEATARTRDGPLATGRRYSNVKGLFVPMSDFYSTAVDHADFAADFKAWESKQGFSFCQYPFLLSIWAKTQVLEHDMRRQMRNSAREAFFDSVMHRREISQVLSLDVRRDCIVDDSLTAVGESLGGQEAEVRKALRISFRGEEGIDGGGLRKEWFLLLIREVFSPERGLFTYDEDSKLCYFNPFTFESSKEFNLIGAILGLAIYNSTILDVPFPPFLFRKLLAAGPTSTAGRTPHTGTREPMRYTVEDLAQYRPALARGFRQILEYDGNVEKDFDLDFTASMNKNGKIESVPLCEEGANRPVTNANRREYVDLYVKYLLDVSVSKFFDPFKRGFYAVCSGNAFCLFRPEEVELLLRGSDESVDISALRGVATYDGWGVQQPDGVVNMICWFWELFEEASQEDQRKLLLFITGSDRLPAAGASMTPLRITNLGEDCGKFPIARTCFNVLSLWNYKSKERLEYMLWRAVHEGGGFGLK